MCNHSSVQQHHLSPSLEKIARTTNNQNRDTLSPSSHSLKSRRNRLDRDEVMGFVSTPAPLCPTCSKSVFFNEKQSGPAGKVRDLPTSRSRSAVSWVGRGDLEGVKGDRGDSELIRDDRSIIKAVYAVWIAPNHSTRSIYSIMMAKYVFPLNLQPSKSLILKSPPAVLQGLSLLSNTLRVIADDVRRRSNVIRNYSERGVMELGLL